MGDHESLKKICITDGNVILYADLNDTVAANDFAKRLPCNFSGADSGIDYCCKAANGVYDPLETQTGWTNGDISLGGGWLAILYGGEEQSGSYRNMMIIGHLDETSLEQIHHLPDKVNFYINFA
jgi:hypothetical protein